jgi:hypothetical protein
MDPVNVYTLQCSNIPEILCVQLDVFALMRRTVVSYGKEYAWFLCLFKIVLIKTS